MYDLAALGIEDLERFSLATRRLTRCVSLNDALQEVIDYLCAELVADATPAVVVARALYVAAPAKRGNTPGSRHDVLARRRNEDAGAAAGELLRSTLAVVRAAGVDVDEVRQWPPAFDERPTVAMVAPDDAAAWAQVADALPGHLTPRSVLVVRFGLPDGAQLCLVLGFHVVLDEATRRLFVTLGGSLRASLIPLTYRVRRR
jgi:hypothetical protein